MQSPGSPDSDASETDGDAARGQLLEEFRRSLPAAPSSAEPITDLAGIADNWTKAVFSSLNTALGASHDGIAVTTTDFLEVARQHYETGFNQAYARVLADSRKADLVDVVLDLLRQLRTRIRDLEQWVQADVRQITAAQSRFDGRNPIFVVRRQIKEAIHELELLKPLFRQPDRFPPMSDECLAVWNLLEGQVLMSVAIAEQLGLGRDRDSVIRKRIAAIRRTGRSILLIRGVGYFRPDAPPPSPPSAMPAQQPERARGRRSR